MKRRLTFLTLFLCALLSSCGRPPDNILRIGSTVWPGYETLYMARERGLLDGSNIHLVEMASGTEVMHALRMGNLEAAALTLDEALRLSAEGIPLQIALIFNFSVGGDGVVAGADVSGLDDLRGRRIGVETGAIGVIMLQALLQHSGLDQHDVDLVYLAIDQTPEALHQGDVDVIVTYEPYLSRAREQGGQLIFDSTAIPDMIMDVLVVREDRAEALHQPLRRLIAAHFKTLGFLHEQPRQAAELMQARLRLEPAAALATLDGLELPDLEANRRWLENTDGRLTQRIERLQGLLLRMGVIHAPIVQPPIPNPMWLPES